MKKDGHETLRGKSLAMGKLHKSVMEAEIEGNTKKIITAILTINN